MKILHKITSFLIVTSFVFSGEVIARNNRIDDRNRTSSITARKRIPTATTRKSSSAARKKISTGVTRRPSTPVTKATPVRPQRKITARKAPIQTSPKARAVSRARTQTRTKPVTINVPESKKVVTPKAKAKARQAPITAPKSKGVTPRRARAKPRQAPVTAPENKSITPSRARAKATQAPVTSPDNKGVSPRRARAKATQAPVTSPDNKGVSPRREKAKHNPTPVPVTEQKKATKSKVKAKPAAVKRHDEAYNSKDITIRTKDIPEDLAIRLSAFGLDINDPDDEVHVVKPSELRELLAAFQEVENYAPGVTQKARDYLLANGYNPIENEDVLIDTATLPEDFLDYLELIDLEAILGYDFDSDETPYLMLTQTQATLLLEKVEQAENQLPGLTQRLREFFKSKYGFKG